MDLNPHQFGFAVGESPLDYHGYHPRRLEILHPALGPSESPSSDYVTGFKTTQRRSPSTGRAYKTPKEVVTPGANPKAAGFIDYTPRPEGPYIHYMNTRTDLEGQGVGRRMVDKFYEMHQGAKEVDWGEIMHPGAGKLFNDRRSGQDDPGHTGPRSYGKIRY